MAKGVDAAAIGMGVKDIVIGIAAAAVGAAGGGQAGASGVLKAGEGIDKLIGMATGESRANNFDRADFAARPAANAATKPTAPQPPQDRDQAVSFLAQMGWTPDQIAKIEAGPAKGSVNDFAPRLIDGQRVELVSGKRIEQVEGSPLKTVSAEAIPLVKGVVAGKTDSA